MAPLVMNVLEPLSTQPPETLRAVVRIPARSEPASGSVMAMASTELPAMASGRKRRCCSGLPNCRMGGMAISVWAITPMDSPPMPQR